MQSWITGPWKLRLTAMVLINFISLFWMHFLTPLLPKHWAKVWEPVALAKPMKKLKQLKKLNYKKKGVPPIYARGKVDSPSQVEEPSADLEEAEPAILYHVVKPGENLWSIARRYQGVTIHSLLTSNRLADPQSLQVNQRLMISPSRSPLAKLRFPEIFSLRWPVVGQISSRFGYRQNPMGGKDRDFHPGIDIKVEPGTPITAALDGEVAFSGRDGGYGYVVHLNHKGGYVTTYAHQLLPLVKEGESVKRGDILGVSGDSGRSTGPHLHFEVRKGSTPLNPLQFLRN